MAQRHVFITGQPGVGKTTLIKKVLQRLSNQDSAVSVAGFYTEELRGSEGRAGFDVVTLSGERGPLARLRTAKKGEPMVGKYVVDLPAFEQLALPQLNHAGKRLLVVDEVGKMELFSGRFWSAVRELLDAGPVVLGTIPVPRYGRAIPQVEELKARADVKVVKISKDSRDKAADQVYQDILLLLSRGGSTQEDKCHPAHPSTSCPRDAQDCWVDRDGGQGPAGPETNPPEPCGPLVGGPPPRTLLLGLTSSPLPKDPSMAYSERSFWQVLDGISGSRATDEYQERVKRVGSLGIAVWDVMKEVHVKAGRGKGGDGKRHKTGDRDEANDLEGFLASHPTIDTLAFNGTNAANAAKKLMPELLAKYKWVLLPSSSGANARVAHREKLEKWRAALLRR